MELFTDRFTSVRDEGSGFCEKAVSRMSLIRISRHVCNDKCESDFI